MEKENFVHILLFRCPRCSEPIAVANSAVHRSIEKFDASEMGLACNCLWTGKALGMEAKRHIVLDWDGAATKNPMAGSDRSEAAADHSDSFAQN